MVAAQAEREGLRDALHVVGRRRRVVEARAQQGGVLDDVRPRERGQVVAQADLGAVDAQVAASQVERQRQIAQLLRDGVETRIVRR
jgi:hypothetical protein